jgi:hypothetical protein
VQHGAQGVVLRCGRWSPNLFDLRPKHD